MAKLVAVGKCESCGKEFVRPPECSHAACDCSSIHEVPLEPALLLSSRQMKHLQRVSELSGVAVEKLADGLLKEAATTMLRRLEVKSE